MEVPPENKERIGQTEAASRRGTVAGWFWSPPLPLHGRVKVAEKEETEERRGAHC